MQVYRVFLFILSALSLNVAGQVKTIGTPYIYNYTKTVYNAGTQNWGIAQDKNGFMYFANNDGIIRFDGLHWDLIRVSRLSPVRAICIDSQNNIYAGLFNDFGIVDEDATGKFVFHSLRHLLPKEISDFDEVWKIYEIPQGIVFQSFNYLFLLQNNKIKIIKPRKRFHFSFNVNGRLFLHEPGTGLFEYINGMVGEVPWAGELKDKEIWAILEIRDNHLLIGTSRNGVYKFENGRLEKWDTPANEMIEKYKLFSATKILGNNFVFGTILNGIIISNADGEVLQHINRNQGLQNNTVLSLFTDNSENLWLGLDNGIDYIEINSPVSYISDNQGIGTGYCARIFDDKLYLGTNQGLFVKSFSNFSRNNEKFSLVENTTGQVWSLNEFNGQLICGHNLGSFIIEGNKAKKISAKEGGWNFINLQGHPDLLLGGHYTGLQLLKRSENGWEFFKDVKGFNESSRNLMQDSTGVVWMSHGGKGVFKIVLDPELDSVANYKLYTSANGLPSNEQNILFSLHNRPYISTIDGIYEYKAGSDKFVKAEKLNSLFNFDGRLKTLETDKTGNIWFIADNESGVFRLNEDLTYTKITSPFRQLDGKYVNEFEFIYPYNNDHVFIGLDNGFAHYSSKVAKSYSQPFKSFITKVELPYIDSTLLLSGKKFDVELKFPYKKNAFRFHYAAPFYENQQQLAFSYFLENFDDDWSQWTSNSYKDFTNLGEGTYVFKIKARNVYGIESAPASIKFKVMPPWYRSKMAVYSYLFLFILFVFLTVRFVLHRMEITQQREAQKHQAQLKEKEERFQHQALIAEKEIIRLRNEKLAG